MVGSAEAWMGLLATHRPAGRATQRQERHRAYLSWESRPRGVTSALCHDAHTMLVSRFHVKPMVKRPTAMFRETSADVSEMQKA